MEPMERVLVLSARFPYPLTDGYRIRVFQISKVLARRYRVDLLALEDGPRSDEVRRVYDHITTFRLSRPRVLRNVVLALPGRDALQIRGYRDPRVSEWLTVHGGEFAFVWCSMLRMSEYALGLAVRPRIIDFHDAYSLQYERGSRTKDLLWRAFYAIERRRVLDTETKALTQFDLAVITSAVDRDHILGEWRRTGGDKNACALEVIHNGVREELLARAAEVAREEDDVIVMLGKMDYHPNEDGALFFARDVFPRLRSQFRSLRFMIVGLNPTRRVKSLARIPGVVVTGFLDDPYTLIQLAKVVVAPVRFGAGIQNKVLEAMALGKAVVTTSVGAQGILGRDSVHYVIADGVETMVARVSELLGDRERRGVIGAAARDLVMRHYRWDIVGDKLLTLVNGLKSGTSERSSADYLVERVAADLTGSSDHR